MSRKIVLIVTSKEDSHADLVIYKLNLRNLQDRVIRLNTEDLWLNTEISTNGSNFEVKILDSQRSFNSEQVLSVWFRRPKEIEVEYIDITGKVKKIGASDFFSHVVQHEVDHLKGILFLKYIKDPTELYTSDELE